MSPQSEQSVPMDDLEQVVIDYLKTHPDFFERNVELLNSLSISHASGGAISLIERQVISLREQETKSRHQLEDFIAVARENELLNDRLHHLTLTLIASCDFDEVINTLEDLLHDDFRAEAVELHLYSSSQSDQKSNPDLDGFRDFIDANRPRCGRLPEHQLQYLFGPQAADIQSTALIPIQGEGTLGLLAIGSHNEHRFHPGMGIDYLVRLGEIVSKTLEVVSEPGI